MKAFSDFAQVTAGVMACIDNAARLLNAARETNKPGQYHIAYHLAAMRLEEIGKASMISIEGLVLAVPNAEHDQSRPSNGLRIRSANCFGQEKRQPKWQFKITFEPRVYLQKNDIFIEFQPTLLIEFFEIFKMALKAYADWD